MEKRTIKRGEIYLADLDPAIGSEQAGERRVLIVSNDVGNAIGGIVIALPITAEVTDKKKKMPMNVLIVPSEKNGQTLPALIECNQIRVLSAPHRLGAYKGTAEIQIMDKVDQAIELSLALKRCFSCDHVLMPNRKKCMNKECGILLVEVCVTCTHEVDVRHNFCPKCGQKRGDE